MTTSMTETRRIVTSTSSVLAFAGAFALTVVTTVLVASDTSSAAPRTAAVSTVSTPAPDSADMPGMDMSGTDHGTSDAPASTPTPTMSGQMPEMDHGTGDSPAKADDHSGDMPGMDMPEDSHEHDATGTAANRPLVPVLGTFGGGTAAVLLTAGMMRRKDRDRLKIREAARAARRSGK